MNVATKTFFALAITTTFLLAHAPPADAATLLDDDELTVDVGGLGEVGFNYRTADHTPNEGLRTDVRLARLKAKARHREWGGFKLQVDAQSGTVELLDLAVDFTPTEWFALQAGRFKLPVSREYMIAAGDMRFSNRALIRRIAPGRAIGLQLQAEHEVGHARAKISTGLFEPGGLDLAQNDGELLVSRLLVEPVEHLEFHLAYAEHILSDNRIPDPDNPDETVRAFPDDRQIDAAVGYHGEHWHLLAEGLAALDPPHDAIPWAAHGSIGYRTPVDGVDVEPALAYDYLDRAHHRIHRGAAALNVYWLDTDLMSTLEYEAEYEADHLAHSVSVLLQAGF